MGIKNLAVGPQIIIAKNIGRFKFDGSVRDYHTYICKYEIFTDFNVAVVKQTTKSPILIPC